MAVATCPLNRQNGAAEGREGSSKGQQASYLCCGSLKEHTTCEVLVSLFHNPGFDLVVALEDFTRCYWWYVSRRNLCVIGLQKG